MLCLAHSALEENGPRVEALCANPRPCGPIVSGLPPADSASCSSRNGSNNRATARGGRIARVSNILLLKFSDGSDWKQRYSSSHASFV